MVHSFGAVGDGYDDAIMDYIEFFYNRQRHHSAPDYRTQSETSRD
jgi:hypothetical protein